MPEFESNREALNASIKLSKISINIILHALRLILQILKGNLDKVKDYEQSERTLLKEAELKHTQITSVSLDDPQTARLAVELNKLGISYSISQKGSENILNFHAINSDIVAQKMEKVLDQFEKGLKPSLNQRIKEAEIKRKKAKHQKKIEKQERKLVRSK